MHKELSQKPELGTGRNIKNMRQRSATNLKRESNRNHKLHRKTC